MTTINEVLRRRRLLNRWRNCLFWSAINALFTCLLIFDLKNTIIGSLIDSTLFHICLKILEVIIGSLLIVNIVYNLSLLFWKKYLMIEIELTSTQMKAFGVKSNEIGFKEKAMNSSINESINQTIGSVTPAFEMSFSDWESPSALSSGHSSLNSTNLSIMSNTSLSTLNSTTTSWEYNPSLSPNNKSISLNDSKMGFIRLRKNTNKSDSLQPIVTNERQLNKYLKDFELREQRLEEITNSEKRHQNIPHNTSWNCNPLEETQNGYQIAIDSPLRLNTDFDSFRTSNNSSKSMEVLFTKLSINQIVMNQWIENLRKWISQTIICRLIDQIDKTNDILAKSSHFDSQIGETSIESLKQLFASKRAQLSSLESILPFLDISTNQNYLVQRIRDLSKGGCIGKFIWNSGGTYNLKPWNEQMPTDSAIIMHLFRTYLDLRLPSDLNIPDGKAFTNSYFKALDGTSPKSFIYLIEHKVNPPHYKVFTEESGVLELPIDRNNLFHAILVFLDSIKKKQLGHLGRINLGSSGVNILWVIQR